MFLWWNEDQFLPYNSFLFLKSFGRLFRFRLNWFFAVQCFCIIACGALITLACWSFWYHCRQSIVGVGGWKRHNNELVTGTLFVSPLLVSCFAQNATFVWLGSSACYAVFNNIWRPVNKWVNISSLEMRKELEPKCVPQ